MKTFLAFLFAATLAAYADDIDFNRAREIMQRKNNGDTISADDEAYLQRAKEEHRKRQMQNNPAQKPSDAPAAGSIDFKRAGELMQRKRSGETLSAADEAFLQRAIAAHNAGRGGGNPGARPADQRKTPEHLTPLCDMTAADRYEGEDGGLYGGGQNTPPDAHRKAALAQLAKIRPLNADGQPDDNGVIGFVAISMSNATQEFSKFKQIADPSPRKSPKVAIVDCAQGGQAMAQWVPPDGRPWQEAKRRLNAARVSPAQVQAAWIKLANVRPGGTLKEHCGKLEADTIAVLHNARAAFPNLRLAYLGSRIYAGYAKTPLNPEPYAYEGAFAVRSLIQRQIKGDADLAETKSPLLLWGPYLWADGARGRKLDKLTYDPGDLGGDGTHPSETGRQKVAELLLNFLTTDPLAAPWFAK
jgi:hypothetical protein